MLKILKIGNLNCNLFWIILWLLLQVLSVKAQNNGSEVRRIKFHGNKNFSDEQLIKVLSWESGDTLGERTEKSLGDTLIHWYNQRGYFFTRIDSFQIHFSSDSQFVDLDFWLQEGKGSYWGVVKITGVEGSLKKMINRNLMIGKGNIFSAKILEKEIDGILDILEDNGYPLAEVEINSLTLDEKEKRIFVNVDLYINKGKRVYIDEIRISGNSMTKDYVIRREARLKVGDMYSHKNVISLPEVLQRTGYFKKVEKPQIIFNQNKAMVIIEVEEGTGNTMDGILGYIPAKNDKAKGYFTGRLQFTFKNLFGTGRFLEAFWEKKDEYSQSIRFGYQEPWLFDFPLHTGIWIHQQIRDTTYVERNWNISARYQPWASLFMQLQAGQRVVLPDSIGSRRYNVPESHTWQLRGSIDYNTFDDLLNPQKGVHYQTSFTWGKKRNIISEYFSSTDEIKKKVNTRSLDIEVEMALPLFSHQVLYLGLHGKEIKTGDQYVNIADQIRFGGTTTVRGYEEDQFSGSRVSWLNCEYRSIVGYHSRVFLFIDSGFYQRKEESGEKIQGYKIGYGFGIRLETKVGMIGIDYGLGAGDSFMEGKLHVGVVSSF
ncbi:MAG: POTRA domain-containing protein [bacterium]